MRGLIVLAGHVFLCCWTASAETYLVRPDGTGDFPTIQAAIDSATDGDVIELADGTFTGTGNRDIDDRGKAITVRSESRDPATCTINCEGSEDDPHRGFLFLTGEEYGSVLEAVQITNGHAAGDLPDCWGGGIYCYYSAPKIDNCLFSGNWAEIGGGAFLDRSSAKLTRCRFSENSAHRAGGLYCELCPAPVLEDCVFVRNTADICGAMQCDGDGHVSLTRCFFSDNDGGMAAGGLLLTSSGASITWCTFSRNQAWDGGGAVVLDHSSPDIASCTLFGNAAPHGTVYCSFGSSPTITKCIFAFGEDGPAIECRPDDSSPQLDCCDIFGNEVGDWTGYIADQNGLVGNISLDPLLCDPDNDDLAVASDSPCAPFSPPNLQCDLIGAWPVGCGPAGVPEFPEVGVGVVIATTWGGVKATYGN